MAAIRSRLLGVLPAGLRFPVGPRLLCSAPPLWWRKGRPRTTHRSFAEVELLSRLAELLMPGEPIGELFRDFPVQPSDAWGSRWLCPDIAAFGVLKQQDAALFVEYDGCHWHRDVQGKQRDERKTEALLAYAPGGSVVLRIGHVTQSSRRKQTSTAMEAMVDVWRAGHVLSLTTSLHQATGSLLISLEDVLEHGVRERLRSHCAEPLPGFDKSRTFVSQAVLARDVETKKANMFAVLNGELQLSRSTINSLESKFPQIWGVSIESTLKPKVAWLMHVGLSRQQVAKVVAGHPQVLGYSIDGNLKPTVAWLEDVGLSRTQVAKVVAGFPQVLGCSINGNLKPTAAWLEHVGLSRQQVAKVVARYPQVLGCSIDGNLKPTVAWLEDVGLSRLQVAKVVAGFPRVLGYSIDGNLKPKVVWLEHVGLSRQQVAKVVARYPQVLGNSIDGNLKPTVAWLEDVGLSGQQVAKVVAGFPQLLGYSIDGNLKPTVAWLEGVGLSRQQVAKIVATSPAVLGCSIQANLSVKHQVLLGFYCNSDICRMLVYLPAMLGYSIKRLHRRLHVLQKSSQMEKLAATMVLTDKRFARRFGA